MCNIIKDIYFGSNYEKKVFSKKIRLKDIKKIIEVVILIIIIIW